MMPILMKGVSMSKRLVVLICAVLLLPGCAQIQTDRSANAKPLQTTVQGGARGESTAPADVGAQASSPPSVQPFGTAAPVGDVPAMATSSAQAPAAPMTPAASGLATTAPVPLIGSDPMSQDLAIAQKIYQGLMPCELGASVRVQADATAPGYFLVQGKGFRYRMYPVRTSTGALRLEDKNAGTVWLQLANKSMLMDQKKGRRVADECTHPEQVAFGLQMKTNPPASLFDKTGMGRSDD